MDDLNTKAKKAVLEEIMRLMDEKEESSLMKHPKLMAAKIEVEPKEDKAEDESEDPSKEMSMSDFGASRTLNTGRSISNIVIEKVGNY